MVEAGSLTESWDTRVISGASVVLCIEKSQISARLLSLNFMLGRNVTFQASFTDVLLFVGIGLHC